MDIAKQIKKLSEEKSSFFELADKDIIKKRMFICLNDDKRLIKPSENINTWRCKVCGCFVTKKTTLKTQSCPIGKW
jgi:rubrerythrin